MSKTHIGIVRNERWGVVLYVPRWWAGRRVVAELCDEQKPFIPGKNQLKIRCECVPDSPNFPVTGQCKRSAQFDLNGRGVCWQHADAIRRGKNAVAFVATKEAWDKVMVKG